MELPRRERDPIPRAQLHSSFNVPGIRAPFQVPQRGLYGEKCTVSKSLPLHILQVPSKRPPPPSRFLSQSSLRERRSTSRAPFIHLSESLGKWAPFQVPRRRDCSGLKDHRQTRAEILSSERTHMLGTVVSVAGGKVAGA
jgi:hypothetical protein